MDSPALITTLRRGLHETGVTGRVIVAVSGGADSIALLTGLIHLHNETSLDLIVAHFHHRLRGDEADGDAAWVEQLARTLGLPFVIGHAPDETDPHATGIEARAREHRYEFLLDTAQKHHALVIVTAHTADDLAETVLHHLLRGTGVAGLRGIPRERALSETVRVVRPLLSVSRREVLAFLQSCGQDYRTDSTNVDERFRRNWLRHHLLPEIRTVYPYAEASLQRLSQQAAELAEAFAFWADQLLDAALLDSSLSAARLRRSVLHGLPRHVQREVFVRLWERQKWPRERMTAIDWDRAAEMLHGDPAPIVLPGGVMLAVRTDLLSVTLSVAQSLPPE